MDTFSFFKFRFIASEKQVTIIVFVICISVKAIPELAAYPHPIGYDVVNYYIPKVVNFQEQWDTISRQFPFYLTFLYSLSASVGLSPQAVVTSVAVAMAGIFGVSLFYIGRTLLSLQIIQSLFLATFTVLQMVVLRTFWDLHKDVMALAAMLFVFCLLGRKDTGWKVLPITLVLTAITVAADRMIGALLCVSLAAFLIMTRRKDVAMVAILAISLFSILIVSSYQLGYTNANTVTGETSEIKIPEFYSRENLLVFFLIVNCLVAAPVTIGFLYMQNRLLKIPLLVSLAGSFSWLVFPENNLLAADRWIIIAGIFLSIFGGYGSLRLVNKLKFNLSAIVAFSIIGAFAAVGLTFALMPYDSPFILYGAVRNYITYFAPVTMQFNSLDVQDNNNLLSATAQINENTERNAIIVGEPQWRGFMELYLRDDRIYHFSNDPLALAALLEQQGHHVYLISAEGNPQTTFRIKNIQNT
ncbi:MAG: hypothetical protein M3114_06680 [Thermoproteota archaeon]|nr:hypothetical protein [Thermoproteota archaeon]